jgi:carbon monoxide dehydrogenase subunit G
MKAIVVQKHVSAAPDRVWQVATDLDSWSETISDIKSVERLAGSTGFGVGTSWRETRVMFGKEATEEMTVTAIVEGISYTVEAESHGAHYTSLAKLTPTGDGTEISMSFSAVATGFFADVMAKTIGKAFEGSMRKALQKDLDDLALAAESSA